jgi:two-component system, cell cycle response regulator DivK
MNTKKQQIIDYTPYLHYIYDVLKYDMLYNFEQNQFTLSETIDTESQSQSYHKQINKLLQQNDKLTIATRDCLSLLSLLSSQNSNHEISLNQTIQAIVLKFNNDEYFNQKIQIQFKQLPTDVTIHIENYIIETLIHKLCLLVMDELSGTDIVLSLSHECGFATISIQYVGEKRIGVNSDNNDNKNNAQDQTTEFHNPISIIKLFEKIGLGVMSFSSQKLRNIINFTMHLPAFEKTTNTEQFVQVKKQPDWTGKTVLIVDDIEVNYIFLETILADTKVNTMYAKNGIEAVEMCRNNKQIDAVLMDIKMPVMDGYEATEIIKKNNPNIPIIIQTAYSFNEEYEKCKEIGCDDYITKPLKSELVISVLAKFLDA